MRPHKNYCSALTGILLVLCAFVLFAPRAIAFDRPYGAQKLILLKSNRPAVWANINGKGPFLLTIDTATSHTILSPELVRRLNLQSRKKTATRVVTASGSVASSYYRLAELETCGVVMEGLPAVELELPYDLGAQGVIGTDFLNNLIVEFNFRTRTVRLFPLSSTFDVTGLRRVEGRLNSHNMILVSAIVDNVPASAIFDTGAHSTVVNRHLAMNAGYYDSFSLNPGRTGISGAGRQVQIAETRKIETLRVGPLMWRSRAILVFDMPVLSNLEMQSKPAIFVGMDIMASHKMIFDYGRAAIWISR